MEIQQILLKREYISYENVFVITDFGAVGDGKTDCTAAIQSALDAAAGFKYIDYSFGCDFAGKTGLLCDNWQKNADRLLKLADERGLKFVQAHSPLGRPLVCDDEHDEFIRLTKQSIEAAAYLGIPNIVVHSGYAKDILREETFKQNKLFYQDILKVAEKHGITVLTENFNKMFDEHYYWVDSAEELLELIEYVNHPLLKAC